MTAAALWRTKVIAGIAAACLAISGSIYAVGVAHGDAVGEIERVKERVIRLEAVPARLDRISDRLGEIAGEVKALRTWFGVPRPHVPAEVTP